MKYPVLVPNIFNYPFTYESEIKFQVGDYVKVPFGKSVITGVIWNEFEKTKNKKFNIKKILEKINIKPLKNETINFLNLLSEYNLVPKGMCLKLHLLAGEAISPFDKKKYEGHYDLNGKSIQKALMKTPINGARLSSIYGMRKHPISGFNKMHKGIDFAAPKGTPVYAGGNGVIERAGRNGGYGNYIRIRHNNEYKTAYAHLSGFKKRISKGVRVNQGEVIGYVGSTGRSTGPHLHYEIIYQNKQINPLTLKLPSGKILEGKELERFRKNYKMILANHLNNLFE